MLYIRHSDNLTLFTLSIRNIHLPMSLGALQVRYLLLKLGTYTDLLELCSVGQRVVDSHAFRFGIYMSAYKNVPIGDTYVSLTLFKSSAHFSSRIHTCSPLTFKLESFTNVVGPSVAATFDKTVGAGSLDHRPETQVWWFCEWIRRYHLCPWRAGGFLLFRIGVEHDKLVTRLIVYG